MASDEQQYKLAMRKWEYLHEREEFSLAPDIGRTAVVYSQYDTVLSDDEESEVKIMHTEFAKEALVIAANINEQNGDPFIVAGISHESFEDAIMANPEVANIIVIGHGTFSSVFCDDGSSIDWLQVSEMSRHLKTGYVEQRFCGQYRFSLSVPFGLFAVQSARKIFASKGRRFSPETHPDHESRIEQVTTSHKLSYRQIRQSFPYQPLFKES